MICTYYYYYIERLIKQPDFKKKIGNEFFLFISTHILLVFDSTESLNFETIACEFIISYRITLPDSRYFKKICVHHPQQNACRMCRLQMLFSVFRIFCSCVRLYDVDFIMSCRIFDSMKIKLKRKSKYGRRLCLQQQKHMS